MTWPRSRRLWPALAGLASGAVLAGVVVLVAPVDKAPTVLLGSLDGRTAASSAMIPGSTSATTSSTAATTATPSSVSPAPKPAVAAVPSKTAPRTTTRPVPSGPVAGVIAGTNAERAAAGCPALRADSRLASAAQGHASDMAANGYFSHTSQDGRDFVARGKAAGYPTPGGENIAQGQRDAAAVMTAWMNSPGHKANILNCSFTTIGVGYDSRGSYWVQDFGY